MKRIRIIAAVLALATVGVVGCGGTNADTVSDNLGKDAEQFKVQRHIVVINGITDKILLNVEGRCSIENGDSIPGALDLICKYGPKDYRKNFIGLSDNVTWTSTQTEGLDVSEYRTKWIIRPESLLPDFDLATGDGS